MNRFSTKIIVKKHDPLLKEELENGWYLVVNLYLSKSQNFPYKKHT